MVKRSVGINGGLGGEGFFESSVAVRAASIMLISLSLSLSLSLPLSVWLLPPISVGAQSHSPDECMR